MGTEETVCEAELFIRHELGLHARPAALFVQTAQKYHSAVSVAYGEREANAKSILSVLSLGVGRDTAVRVRATGPDAMEAVAALSRLVADDFEKTG